MFEILDLIHYFEKYGPWGLLIGLFVIIRKNRRLKRIINEHLPRILKNNGDSDIEDIKLMLKMIMNHLGIKEERECANTLKPCEASIQRNLFKRFISSPMGQSIVQFIKPYTNLRRKKMKEYLKKLGSRKFQAFLVATATNIIMLTGYLFNVENIQSVANEWVPVINVVAQAVTTLAYVWAQGGVDKEAVKGAQSDEFTTPIEPTK